MKKFTKYILITLLVFGVLFSAAYFAKTNSKSAITYKTEKLFKTTIEKETVVTGKIVPEDEVEVKPQIGGIIDRIFVEEGDQVTMGDLIARIKVVPNEQNLNAADGRVKKAQIAFNTRKKDFDRNKILYEKGIISNADFIANELLFNQAKQDVLNAESDLQIIKEGSIGGSSAANTDIRATVPGTVLEIPVKEGDQVIESNSFNAGTTIAAIADLGKMIFEGKVDEAEVASLRVGTPLKVSLGAIEDQELDASLQFIAPKGTEEQGAVQFKIEADLVLNDSIFVRAGYSANASIVLDRKEDVLALREALIQFDRKTQDPFVEIMTGDQKFERREVKLGISDGVNVEILEGVAEEDQVKVWNRTEERDEDNKNEEDDA
ncbi:MAG: efflux RND transporter periplasmic adaptor subunit [Bacteroidetes bacterium]|nr:efflux RND transporter periplasmic adaptor subunit [Bacteroidota bacterium]MDA0888568.1 efflux RND transporter periplasmic adaptor subunit [Bacteroidota bacterium]MDA1084211.1 efflux RND transporter periplasmic adaptor subunit [Bacteroidota bacterium]